MSCLLYTRFLDPLGEPASEAQAKSPEGLPLQSAGFSVMSAVLIMEVVVLALILPCKVKSLSVLHAKRCIFEFASHRITQA